MLGWMSYVIVVSMLLALAALAFEGSARVRQRPTRWLWSTSMIASVLLPLMISSVAVQVPPQAGIVDPAPPPRTASGPSPSDWLTATAGELPASADLDRLLQVGWGAASTILLLAILASHLQLHRRRRRWERGNMAGAPVHISEETGPAIVGLLKPHIVVPRWLMHFPTEMQELVIAHEQGHLEARDARLVTIALGLLVCMPWNLPLWWQLRRLRFAIEIDCDARVVRRGYDVSRYGETLIAVGERQSATIATVAAMSEQRSFLEQRIRTMLRKRTRYAHATAAAFACLGIAFAVGAAEISPPDNHDPGRSQESAADIIRRDHAGFYRLNDNTVLAIINDGQHLIAQFTGQPSVPILARSNTEFSYKDKRIRFVTASDGRTTSLILHQHGIDMPMKRIDAATALRVASARTEQRDRSRADRLGAVIILR